MIFKYIIYFVQYFYFLFTESVRALLGRHTKILVKYMVKLDTKGDKTENRVLVSMSILKYYLLFCKSSSKFGVKVRGFGLK